jgi:alcohol dehydrogenase class IV
MGVNFEFTTVSKIIFGQGSFEKIPELVAGQGKKVLLVTGKNTALAHRLGKELNGTPISFEIFSVANEPTTHNIQSGTELARKTGCDMVVGIGGGSAIDSAKAIAALVPNKGELTDYLEVIGKGLKLTETPLPCFAVPTTAGTGAEVTRNSVIKSTENQVKVSLRSELMYPRIAVVDPVLTVTMPPEITASTGVDALTHLLETFVSIQSNPFIDMFCREGIKRVSVSLLRAFTDGNDMDARENMALASMFGGIALANVKLGAVHGFAGPLGGMCPVPHGAACACLLPATMEVNITALKKENRKQQLAKFEEIARILTGRKSAVADDGTIWAKELVRKLRIPPLSAFGLSPGDFPELVKKAQISSSIKGNPVGLNQDQLLSILEKSF